MILRVVRPTLFAALLAVVLASMVPSAHATPADAVVTARPITQFRIGSNAQQFGPLAFVGGLEMVSPTRDFGALSAIGLRAGSNRFVMVADTGFFVIGDIARDQTGVPTGLSGVQITQIPGPGGATTSAKWQADAEGIAIDGERLLVSFEREHRIVTFAEDGAGYRYARTDQPPVPLRELRQNRGFEGIAFASAASPFAGALVGVSEKSLDRAGNIMGFVQQPDGTSHEFSVRRTDEFDVTDIGFLPDGDLILLERRFTILTGVAMRLRRISRGDIVKGATVDGNVMLEADMRYQIDNMEGLAITVDPDGVPRLTIVSDDNHSLLQRNLLLEFRLTGQPGG